ncbi:MAG: sulfatase-like hydrolase/transferase, partial [Porticoccaceae bacterium]
MKSRLLSHVTLTFYAVLVTWCFALVYLAKAPLPSAPVAAVYFATLLGYYGLLIILVSILLSPLGLFTVTRWLIPVALWLWLIFLLIDAAVFDLYHFHVEWLIIEMFFFDFRGMGIPLFLLIVAGLVGVALLLFAFWVQRYSSRVSSRQNMVARRVLLLIIPVFVVNTLVGFWAYRYDREEITQYAPFLPAFSAITSYSNGERIAALLPTVFPPVAGQAVSGGADEGMVNYPLEAPQCHSEQPASILMIVLESWQAETLNAEIMPNLWNFSQGATRYQRHLSSGSATVPGLFGLMYGLHPTYYDKFKAVPLSHPSLFTKTLDELAYRQRVFTSGDLDRFALRSLFFSQVAKDDYHQAKKDGDIVDRFVASFEEAGRPNQPNFDFLFLTSSHSTYIYPKAFQRFEPVPRVEGSYALHKMADNRPFKNDYRNSLFYIDSLLGRVFATLEKTGALANTWVIITGDHGEEFNENGLGFWGHGSNFSRWQTQVPLVVKAPGIAAGATQNRVSMHQDIAPTLMENALGCVGERADYSNGEDLFDLPDSRASVLSSYVVNAYWIDGVVYERTTGKKYAWDGMAEISA